MLKKTILVSSILFLSLPVMAGNPNGGLSAQVAKNTAAIAGLSSSLPPNLGDTATDGFGGIVACSTAKGGIRNLIVETSDNTAGTLSWTGVYDAIDPFKVYGPDIESSRTDGLGNLFFFVFRNTGFTLAGAYAACALKAPSGKWFLPAIEELGCVIRSGVSGMTFGTYWSSTQASAAASDPVNRALAYQGDQERTVSKASNISFRCVRATS